MDPGQQFGMPPEVITQQPNIIPLDSVTLNVSEIPMIKDGKATDEIENNELFAKYGLPTELGFQVDPFKGNRKGFITFKLYRPTGYSYYGFTSDLSKGYYIKNKCATFFSNKVCSPASIDNIKGLLPKILELNQNGNFNEVLTITQSKIESPLYGPLIYSATYNPTPVFTPQQLNKILDNNDYKDPKNKVQTRSLSPFGLGGGGRRSRRYRKGRRPGRRGTKRSGRRGTKRFVRRRK